MSDAIQDAAAEALKEAVPWHTVGIITRSSAGDCEQGIGTGAVVRWHKHSLILTAKHVVEGTPPEELWFYLRPDGTLNTHAVQDVNPANIGLESRRRLPVCAVVLSEAEDLALLDLDVPPTGIDNLRFHALDGDASTPQPGEMVIVAGYPSDLGHPVGQGAMAAFLSIQATFIEQPRPLHNHSPANHFLARHEFSTDGIHARGISGAGVWFRRIISSGIWHANLELAGIATHYYPDEQLLEVVRVERVISFLRSTYPENITLSLAGDNSCD